MANCLTPLLLKKNNYQPVPCSKCPNCMKRRTSGWSFRLMKEGEKHLLSFFVTLTYDTDHVPISPKGFMSLDKTHIQDFMKAVRHYSNRIEKSKNEIKYYACGEYGTKTMRPHYHLIMFGATQQAISHAWKKGSVFFGSVNGASIGYTLKYMTKPKKIPMHQNDDREKESSLMSKKMGSNYLTPEMIKWHIKNLDENFYVPLPDGKKAPMPRYYKNKIYNSEQAGHLKGVMEKISIQKETDERKKYPTEEEYNYHTMQQVKQAFDKMYRKSTENRQKN